MWQQTTNDDPEWTELRYGEGIVPTIQRKLLVVEDDAAIYRYTVYGKRVRPEAQELKALLDKWRAEGKGELADEVESAETERGSLWHSFEEFSGEDQVKETRYEFSDPMVRLMKWVEDPVIEPGVQPGGGTILWYPGLDPRGKGWFE